MLAARLDHQGPIKNEIYFTAENKTVWALSLKQKEEFINNHKEFILKNYIDGFYALEFNSNEIPTLEKLNYHLKTTGWKAIYVDGYLHQNYYAELLAQKITPISRHIRSLVHLNYAPGPDMLHDIFGHLPMLFSSDYCDYLTSLGKAMVKATAQPSENQLYHLYIKLANAHEAFGSNHFQTKEIEKKIKKIEHELDRSPPIYTLLGRFFMWTIEFGILSFKNKFQMYGAGLLSSKNESLCFCEGKTQVTPFTHTATKTGYDFSSFQKQLFFSDSFSFLKDELKSFDRSLSC